MKRLRGKNALALLVIALMVVAMVGVMGTGAYFSHTHNGTITGNVGSIDVTTAGGGGADQLELTFNNLLPGEKQTVTAYYQNTGSNAQDVWLVFPNKTALSALNSLGTYGEAHILANGTEIFASNNLNDHPVDQGAVCKAIPQKIQIASNVAPGATGSVSFTFNYASKLSGSGGGVWNTYPVLSPGNTGTGGYPTNDGALAGYDQYYVNAADGSGSGLPYQIVATQVGQQP